METQQHKIAFIGIGLIGASLAKDLRKLKPDSVLIGTDQSIQHLEIALQEKIIDIRMSVEEAASIADVIFVSIPVSEIPGLINFCLNKCKEDALVIDVGSTKFSICNSVADHPKRKNFVAAHPIAGTENAGPLSSLNNLFKNKLLFICEKEKSHPELLNQAEHLFKSLGMVIHFIDPQTHDEQMAALSHLSHALAYCLANAAMKMENPEVIERVAGTGFASTVRLAKSKSSMWTPIFLENRHALIDAISVLELELQAFKLMLLEQKNDQISTYICKANAIGAMIKKKEELILN